MTFIQLIFYAFAIVAVGSALMVVASPNPVRSALFLVLAFFAMSGVWMLLQAEFLALILVLVYVGAVMTLFLFVVMMLKVDSVSLKEGFVRYLPVALLLVLCVMGLAILAISKHFGESFFALPPLRSANYNNIASLGSILYTDYAYPFEIAGVVLLAAIVAAISLSHKKPKNRIVLNPGRQAKVKREDRVHLIKMPSEKKIRPVEGGES